MVSRVVAVTVVLVALVGGAAYFGLHRFDGGPLAYESGAVNVELFEVGQTRTFLHAMLVNTGGREIRVERVAPQWPLEHSRVEIWAPRPGVRRPSDQSYPFPSGRVEGEPFPPPGTTLAELRPAAGARVAGRKGSTVARLPLLIAVTPMRQGCAGFGGLVVDYRSGLRRYRRVMVLAFGGHAGQGRTPGQARRRLTPCIGILARLHDRLYVRSRAREGLLDDPSVAL